MSIDFLTIFSPLWKLFGCSINPRVTVTFNHNTKLICFSKTKENNTHTNKTSPETTKPKAALIMQYANKWFDVRTIWSINHLIYERSCSIILWTRKNEWCTREFCGAFKMYLLSEFLKCMFYFGQSQMKPSKIWRIIE